MKIKVPPHTRELGLPDTEGCAEGKLLGLLLMVGVDVGVDTVGLDVGCIG